MSKNRPHGFGEHRYHVLDGMRGIAAIAVFLYHLLHPVWLKNSFLAVDFFFVLSGFVIFHAYGEKLSRDMSAREFLARRIGRLYPLMMAGVVIGALFLYSTISYATSEFSKNDFWIALTTNLFMLPYFNGGLISIQDHTPEAVNFFPTNGPLWSVSLEMLAGFCFLMTYRLSNARLKGLCYSGLILLISVSVYYGSKMNTYFMDTDIGWNNACPLGGLPRVLFGFTCGMLLYRFHSKSADVSTTLKKYYNPWLLYVVLLIMFTFPFLAEGIYDLFAIAIIVPLLVWLGSNSHCSDAITLRISEFLGWLSYPLYCLHTPIQEMVFAVDRRINLQELTGVHRKFFVLLLTFIISIFIATFVDRFKLQRRLTDLLK